MMESFGYMPRWRSSKSATKVNGARKPVSDWERSVWIDLNTFLLRNFILNLRIDGYMRGLVRRNKHHVSTYA